MIKKLIKKILKESRQEKFINLMVDKLLTGSIKKPYYSNLEKYGLDDDEIQNVFGLYRKIKLTKHVEKILIESVSGELKYLTDSDDGGISLYFNDDVFDTFKSFIVDQMIFNHHEIFKNGEEILVSHKNGEMITEKDIDNYIETNPKLKRYLKQLLVKFYYENIDFEEILSNVIDHTLDHFGFIPMEQNSSFKHIDYIIYMYIDKSIENLDYSTHPYDVIGDNDFNGFLKNEFLNSDIIEENDIDEDILLDEAEESGGGESTSTSSGGGETSTPGSEWSSGVSRGPANPIDSTSVWSGQRGWEGIKSFGTKRGVANKLS